jgi:Protein of unknown function (DUF3800)
MKVCYVDESGHCGTKHNSQQPVEVLCGVMTDITKLFKTQREHSEIVRYLQSRNIPLEEIKASKIYKGRDEWQKVSPALRDDVYSALLEWSKSRVCKFIVCPIDSLKFFSRKKNGCQIASELHCPWEAGALNVAMAIQREHSRKKNNKGRTFVIFDEQDKHDKRFLQLFERDISFTDGFTGYEENHRKGSERFDQIIDVPHFSKSHLSGLIQLADLGAYTVNRHLLLHHYGFSEEYDGEKNKVSQWYEYIGANLLSHTSIDAPGSSEICDFYRVIRPEGWKAKAMKPKRA